LEELALIGALSLISSLALLLAEELLVFFLA
jgi:hypothetical protein